MKNKLLQSLLLSSEHKFQVKILYIYIYLILRLSKYTFMSYFQLALLDKEVMIIIS